MLWLDENLRVDAQTTAQGHGQYQLDIPVDSDGLQYHSTEGIRLPAGNMTLSDQVGRRRGQMGEQNNFDRAFSAAMAFYKSLDSGHLKD